MDKAKILFVSQEIMPYLPETEISRASRNLPQGILEKGKEIRTFMPRFGNINERRNQLHEVIRLSGMNLIIDDTDHPLLIKVASIQAARMQIYFIDNDDYFHRKGSYIADGEEYADNDERTIFYARGVLETTKKLRWAPDIIHCHGWFTAFVPFYVKKLVNDDPHFVKSKVVFSLYASDFKQKWDGNIQAKAFVEGIDKEALSGINVDDFESLMRFAIDYADAVVQGGPEVPQSLIEYAKQSGKPFLEYTDDSSLVESCNDFYNNLLGITEEED